MECVELMKVASDGAPWRTTSSFSWCLSENVQRRKCHLGRQVVSAHSGGETYQCDECRQSVSLPVTRECTQVSAPWNVKFVRGVSSRKIPSFATRDSARAEGPFASSTRRKRLTSEAPLNHDVSKGHTAEQASPCDSCNENLTDTSSLSAHVVSRVI
ncbi:hypothetical protein FOCC_FOCC008357 [Frankliniella occidentalis]|nr:hypothetical protein FOCC_FOCC008357 [Frankliniella occidentalis]